ncbi:hypothetical protein C8Q72DRAFT_790407 [Fomitopsis betulina]|nr:hypothetical protein C8Q72DRAFT_790407 [Fomitopsis betulina]
MMKTNVLFSSPCLCFSRSQQDTILAWGRELGAGQVPSLYTLEKFQKEALDVVGNPTEKVTVSSGNMWYKNLVAQVLRSDYANHKIWRQIHKYPVFNKTVSKVWHTEKWLIDAPDDILTPMIHLEDRHDFC